MSHMQNSEERGSAQNNLLIPASIIAAGVIIALAVLYIGGGSRVAKQPPAAGDSGTGRNAGPVDLAKIADDDPSLGNPNAPVTVVEFSDFQCPFCERLYSSVLPQLKKDYISSGKVRFVYRDFPLTQIHPMAQKAAEAAECADDQGKFWEYHDILFQRQSQLSLDNLKRWASELKLDTGKFGTCLDSATYAAEVTKDTSDGQALGVNGTPGTFVNGQFISGAVPYEQFKAAIEAELAKAN